ncbi:unnamed protein product [Protopolystoma xenopodis]|uniref:Uncharacterized protein n=1 Tax=Protopolystoma xenopodis TaxID=117903 RepID=A0A448XFJ3_9PLAT|nr:unnamed protein product [Protopolystoma xenopodis]
MADDFGLEHLHANAILSPPLNHCTAWTGHSEGQSGRLLSRPVKSSNRVRPCSDQAIQLPVYHVGHGSSETDHMRSAGDKLSVASDGEAESHAYTRQADRQNVKMQRISRLPEAQRSSRVRVWEAVKTTSPEPMIRDPRSY